MSICDNGSIYVEPPAGCKHQYFRLTLVVRHNVNSEFKFLCLFGTITEPHVSPPPNFEFLRVRDVKFFTPLFEEHDADLAEIQRKHLVAFFGQLIADRSVRDIPMLVYIGESTSLTQWRLPLQLSKETREPSCSICGFKPDSSCTDGPKAIAGHLLPKYLQSYVSLKK